MAALGPALVVDAPPLSPPPSGLLNAATVIDHLNTGDDARWINGVTYRPEPCDDAVTFDPCTTVSGDVAGTFADGVTASNTTVTSATAKFNVGDIGHGITGANIPANTTITRVNSATNITISRAATASATGVSITIANRNAAPNSRPALTFIPFGVEAWQTCSAFGFERGDYEGRARRALGARETKAVEKEFMSGARISTNRHLQDATNTTSLNGGTAVPAAVALSLLVQAIADNNLGSGMIHARPQLVTMWDNQRLLRWQSGKLYTAYGNLVVPGAGYSGASPSGTAPVTTSEWAYATDAVQVHRSEVEVFVPETNYAQNMDRNINEITVRAQRMYSVLFNACAVLGVNVDPTA